MQMIERETDQILVEELFDELPGLRGAKFISASEALDSDRRTAHIKNNRNENIVIRFFPGGSLESHKEAMRRAFIEHDPSILDDLD